MTAGAFYRRLAGLLLLWSLLPLPFLYIVMPPFWITAGIVALALILVPSWSPKLEPWALNLIAVLIVIGVVAAGGIRVGPLRPLGHLLLLLTAVRVSQIIDRRSFLKALPAIFLVWVVSLTSSTHVTALVYFAVSAVVWWWTGMEIQLAAVAVDDGVPAASVRPRHALVAAVVALALAVPVFVSVPRLRSPWLAGSGGVRSVTGFSSRVELSGIGTIQESQERVLVVRSVNGEPIRPEWMRLRATAFERMTVESWAPRPPDRSVRPRSGLIWLTEGDEDMGDAAQLEIELDRPDEFLFLPGGAIAVDVPEPVRIDPAGGVVLVSPGTGPLHYTVWVSRTAVQQRLVPPPNGGLEFEPAPEVRALAIRIAAGAATAEARAAAVEAYLQNEYTYSMTGLGRIGPDPVSWFLLRSRSGHCEYFAGGMAVMMGALGDPARMVGGYSGGDLSQTGDEVVVRQANAHAWVEVWLGPRLGWGVFDPTPAVNLPRLNKVNLGDRLRFAWENIQAGWDKYVLTFGVAEQMQLLTAAGDRLAAALSSWRRRDTAIVVGALALLWLTWRAVRWFLRRTSGGRSAGPASPASRSIRRLVRRLERSGVTVPVGATVRWIGQAATRRWPSASQPAADLVWLAERELYSEDGSVYGPVEVRRVWSDLRHAIRDSRRDF